MQASRGIGTLEFSSIEEAAKLVARRLVEYEGNTFKCHFSNKGASVPGQSSSMHPPSPTYSSTSPPSSSSEHVDAWSTASEDDGSGSGSGGGGGAYNHGSNPRYVAYSSLLALQQELDRREAEWSRRSAEISLKDDLLAEQKEKISQLESQLSDYQMQLQAAESAIRSKDQTNKREGTSASQQVDVKRQCPGATNSVPLKDRFKRFYQQSASTNELEASGESNDNAESTTPKSTDDTSSASSSSGRGGRGRGRGSRTAGVGKATAATTTKSEIKSKGFSAQDYEPRLMRTRAVAKQEKRSPTNASSAKKRGQTTRKSAGKRAKKDASSAEESSDDDDEADDDDDDDEDSSATSPVQKSRRTAARGAASKRVSKEEQKRGGSKARAAKKSEAAKPTSPRGRSTAVAKNSKQKTKEEKPRKGATSRRTTGRSTAKRGRRLLSDSDQSEEEDAASDDSEANDSEDSNVESGNEDSSDNASDSDAQSEDGSDDDSDDSDDGAFEEEDEDTLAFLKMWPDAFSTIKKSIPERFRLLGRDPESVQLATRRTSDNLDEIYGEVEPPFFSQILRLMEVDKNTVLLDIGSGIGNLCFQAVAQTGCRAIGVEIRKELHEMALALREPFAEHLKRGDFPCDENTNVEERLDFQNGDASDNEWVFPEGLSLVFINNWRFGPDTQHRLLQNLFGSLIHGTRVVTLKELFPQHRGHKSRSKDEITSIYRLEMFKSPIDPVSWDSRPIDYYCYTCDRSESASSDRPRSTRSSRG